MAESAALVAHAMIAQKPPRLVHVPAVTAVTRAGAREEVLGRQLVHLRASAGSRDRGTAGRSAKGAGASGSGGPPTTVTDKEEWEPGWETNMKYVPGKPTFEEQMDPKTGRKEIAKPRNMGRWSWKEEHGG